jgi:hypothetical protein
VIWRSQLGNGAFRCIEVNLRYGSNYTLLLMSATEFIFFSIPLKVHNSIDFDTINP